METNAQIDARLNRIPEEFSALRDHLMEYLPLGSVIDSDNNLLVGHMPRVGAEAYLFTLFAPARKEWFVKFSESVHKEIPHSYQALLLVTNGYFAFDLSLYGLAPSMQKSPRLLDRTKRQCHDVSEANRFWIKEFGVSKDQFYFGGRAWSASENLGYFIGPDAIIRALLRSGEMTGEWSTLSVFLKEELTSAAAFAKTPGSMWA